MNFMTGLCSDWVFFNSEFHRAQFFDGLPRLLKRFPDYSHVETIRELESKSSVLPVGCDLRRLEAARPSVPARGYPPLILWNQRWEYDKGPDTFFRALSLLARE
jgi:glycosyltransferase involved in cell wall biosynthesis